MDAKTGRLGTRGTTARALGVATVYLAARDVLRVSGALGPEYHSDEGLIYKFKDDSDNSEFIIKQSWLRGPRREYISGPREGQSEKITDAEAEQYRRAGEEEFGKYIPGKNPRFIPGNKQHFLWYYQYDRDGIRHTVGTIDEKGVHMFEPPREYPRIEA
jgi:hypothetical protein